MLMKVSVVLALVLLGGAVPAHADVQVIGVGSVTYGSGCTADKVVNFETSGDDDFAFVMQGIGPGSKPPAFGCGLAPVDGWHASSRTQFSPSCPPTLVPQGYSRDDDTYTVVQQQQCVSNGGPDATATTILTVNASTIDFKLTIHWPVYGTTITMEGVLTRVA